MSTVISGLTSTHKNWWECDTGIAYIGYIYIVDLSNTGMHILDLTGAARAIANFP